MAELRRFGWFIEKVLAGSAHPGTFDNYNCLVTTYNIGAVVNFVQNPSKHWLKKFPIWLTENNVWGLHLPTKDGFGFTTQQLWGLAHFFDGCVEEGRPLVLHCKMGVGRTGTGLVALVMYHQRKTVAEAFDYVVMKRPVTSMIEDRQYRSLRRWESDLQIFWANSGEDTS